MANLRGGPPGDSAGAQGPLGALGRRLHLGGVSSCKGLIAALELSLDELDSRRKDLIQVSP